MDGKQDLFYNLIENTMTKNAKEEVVKAKRHSTARKSDVLKVSKSIKCQAASASMFGVSFRRVIRVMGEAEDSYKKTGRLILGGKAD